MVKKLFWKLIRLCYPYLRDFLLFTRIAEHSGRQEYHIGFVGKNFNRITAEKIMGGQGFEKAVCAWIDDGEVLSMRKTHGKYQCHLRLFSDGELRGHYEYSPEGNLLGHLRGSVFKPEKNYFRRVLQNLQNMPI